jgi:hypothetical protein
MTQESVSDIFKHKVNEAKKKELLTKLDKDKLFAEAKPLSGWKKAKTTIAIIGGGKQTVNGFVKANLSVTVGTKERALAAMGLFLPWVANHDPTGMVMFTFTKASNAMKFSDALLKLIPEVKDTKTANEVKSVMMPRMSEIQQLARKFKSI